MNIQLHCFGQNLFIYTLEHSKRLLLTSSSNALPGPETTDGHPQDFKKHSDTALISPESSSTMQRANPHAAGASGQLIHIAKPWSLPEKQRAALSLALLGT